MPSSICIYTNHRRVQSVLVLIVTFFIHVYCVFDRFIRFDFLLCSVGLLLINFRLIDRRYRQATDLHFTCFAFDIYIYICIHICIQFSMNFNFNFNSIYSIRIFLVVFILISDKHKVVRFNKRLADTKL